MERVWKEDRVTTHFKTEISVIDKLLAWLEKDDTEMERVAGYCFCLAAVTYFISRLFQSL